MKQEQCVYCVVLMVYRLGTDRRTHPRAVTIERADNDVPHVITNCVLACQACNSKRGASYTYDEFLEYHADIKLNLVKKCQDECQQIPPITSFHKKEKRHHSACKACRRSRPAGLIQGEGHFKAL
jgi:5-methylcytosine-specific restriction endonuclease McrA